MHNNSLSTDKSQLTYIENVPNYCICRTNNVTVRPGEKICRTSLTVPTDIPMVTTAPPLTIAATTTTLTVGKTAAALTSNPL